MGPHVLGELVAPLLIIQAPVVAPLVMEAPVVPLNYRAAHHGDSGCTTAHHGGSSQVHLAQVHLVRSLAVPPLIMEAPVAPLLRELLIVEELVIPLLNIERRLYHST